MTRGQGEFSGADARRQGLGQTRRLLLALGRDKLLQRRLQRRLRKGIALNSGKNRFGESFGDIIKRGAMLFAAGVVGGGGSQERHNGYFSQAARGARDTSFQTVNPARQKS